MSFFCDLLNTIHRALGCCTPHVSFRIGTTRDTVGAVTKTPQFQRHLKCGGYLVATTMETGQHYTLSVQFLDKKGKPAPVDGIPVWATDNSDLLALIPAADGMSCEVQSLTIAGTGKVQLTADADLGAGVVPIIGTDDVTVTLPPATTVVLTPGPVSDLP